jgi:Domain of unknown function (DUF4365)
MLESDGCADGRLNLSTKTMLLTPNNVKSELSYAYLHAVAAHAGCTVAIADRHTDGAGIDAIIRAKERFSEESVLTHFTIEVQLKATSRLLEIDNRGRYPFSLEIPHYDKLRDENTQAQLILVVLLMPENREEWLSHSEESLTAKRCAYWVSLRGAPESQNTTSQTIYLPQSNRFSPESLRALMTEVSRGRKLNYEL